MHLSEVVPFLGRLAKVVSTGWLILGITLLLFLGLETGYRVLYSVLHQSRDDSSTGLSRPDHPYRETPWFRQWVAGREEMLRHATRYDPYRGWQVGPVSRPGLHIDSAGRRFTPQPPAGPAQPRQVFMLGGSTMWGYAARDSATIPALVARELAVRGFRDVAVVNMANIGYNVTQEAITLMLELRRGNVPAVAVALDGVNEAGVVFEGGKVGNVYDQAQAERRLEHRGLLQDLVEHSELVKQLLILTSGGRTVAGGDVCPQVAEYYGRMVGQIEALSQAYGFTTYFLWQPTLARSRKARTSWEEWVDSTRPELQRMTLACSARTDSIMQPVLGHTYFPLHRLFDADTASVFLDQYGHVTEWGNEGIARRIAELIAPTLAEPPGSPRRPR